MKQNLKGKMLLKHTKERVGEKVVCNVSVDAIVKDFDTNDTPGFIAGWASTSSVDSYGHIVQENAFLESMQKRGISGPKAIKLLIGHKWDQVAGVISKLEYRGGKLWIEAQMNLNISYVKDSYEAAKMLGGMNFSVGFYIEDYKFEGKDRDEHLVITKADLFEVSVVPFPANEDCTMEVIKDDLQPKTLAEFEKALVAKGLVQTRNDAQKIVREIKSSLPLFLNGKEQSLEENSKPKMNIELTKKLNNLASSLSKLTSTLTQDGK